MKLRILAFTAFVVIFGLTLNVQASKINNGDPKIVEKKDKLPTTKDYETYLERYKTHSNNLANKKFWEATSLRNKDTGKVVSWKDTPDKDRRLVVMMFADRVSVEMRTLHGHWMKEVAKLKNFKDSGKELPEGAATLEEVEEYLAKLMHLRKDTAVKYEKLAEQYFKDFDKEYTKDEVAKHLKSIRDWHDEEKLIERNK